MIDINDRQQYQKKVHVDRAMQAPKCVVCNAIIMMQTVLGLRRLFGGFGSLPSPSLSDPSAKIGTFEALHKILEDAS